MEITIKNPASRILLERAENGIILYEISEDNVVLTRLVYETHYHNGLLNFENIAQFMMESLELLKVPAYEMETDTKLAIIAEKISESEKGEQGDDDE
jgi:hypothetical protein